MLNHIKTKDLDDQTLVGYWRFVDLVLVKLHTDGEGRKACEFAKIASKIYFDKFELATAEKKGIIQERYLKFFINTLLYAISSPSKYDFLSFDVVLANKAFLDTKTYRNILAFFETELKHRIKDENHQNEDEELSKTVYLNRFRQHLCKISGLKLSKAAKNDISPKKGKINSHEDKKSENSSEVPVEENRSEISEPAERPKKERETKKIQVRRGRPPKKASEDNLKKRTKREYDEGIKDPDEKKEAEEMIHGKKNKKMGRKAGKK